MYYGFNGVESILPRTLRYDTVICLSIAGVYNGHCHYVHVYIVKSHLGFKARLFICPVLVKNVHKVRAIFLLEIAEEKCGLDN